MSRLTCPNCDRPSIEYHDNGDHGADTIYCGHCGWDFEQEYDAEKKEIDRLNGIIRAGYLELEEQAKAFVKKT